MNTMTISAGLRCLIIGALFGAVTSSFAGIDQAPVLQSAHVTVKYSDLDVTTASGAATLYGRIHNAATAVCFRVYDSNLGYSLNRDICIRKAIAGAVTQLNQAALNAVYAAKYKTPLPNDLLSRDSR
jgi:UrcA family protein